MTIRVIPCLDVTGGRVVKGVRFEGLRDMGDPAELAARYESEEADEIAILDISATSEERETAYDAIAAVRRATTIPITAGGGVRSVNHVQRMLDSGADRVTINSAVVAREDLLAEIVERFGTHCCMIAIDAAVSSQRGWEVLVRAGKTRTGLDAVEWANRCERLGAGEILLTSWDRDGTGSGYDLDLIRAVSSSVNIPVIASGGAAGAHHMIEAYQAGAAAVLAASIFHDGSTKISEVKQLLAGANTADRTGEGR